MNGNDGNVDLNARVVKLTEANVDLTGVDMKLSEIDMDLNDRNVDLTFVDMNLSDTDADVHIGAVRGTLPAVQGPCALPSRKHPVTLTKPQNFLPLSISILSI